jgi:hypothetical protein
VAGSCEYGDEPSGSGVTELVGLYYSVVFEGKYVRMRANSMMNSM